MPFRTILSRAAVVTTAGLLALPATPAWSADTTVVDVLTVVDGEYVVETVTVPAATADTRAEELEDRPDVVVASPQVVYQLDSGVRDPYWDSSDPQAASRVRDVWARSRGEGQVVAVLDTAAAIEHEDLFGAVLPGHDAVGGAGEPWHGYGVAGVIAARADNNLGSAGMAPAAKVLPVRVCSSTCPSDAIARGILWAADHGADVINMSLSGPGYSDVTATAVQYALDKGISVVASAGNDGLNGNPVMYPAALEGVIGVSSTTPSGAVSNWAVHGWQVDVSTVGDSVLLTMPGDGYGSGSGTSFSGPAVAGAVALLRASHPGISPREVQAVLQAGSDSSGTWDRAWGAGRLDLPGAMAAADASDARPTVTASSGAVDVSWDAVPGASSSTVRVDGVVRAQVTGATAQVSGLTVGNQVAVDVQADTGARSRPVLATVAAAPPAVPVLHSATLRGTSTSAVLDLTASVDGPLAARYALIRDGVSIGNLNLALTATPKTFGIGIGAMPTTQTQWQLRPVDAYARVGPRSNTVTTGTTVPPAPGAPTGLAGRIQDGETLLSWDGQGAGRTYRVSVEGSVVATPSTPGVVLPAPPLGSSRTYSVAVVDGWSQVGPDASTTVTRTLSAPTAPRMGTPTAQSTSVTIRWQPPTDDGGSPVTGYTVQAHRGGSAFDTRSVGAATGSAMFSGTTLGTTYTFTVAATNAVGTGPQTAPLDVTPVVPPGAPTLGTATPGDGSVLVRWSAPTDTGGGAITSYALTASPSTPSYATISRTAEPGAGSATLTGLTNGIAYTVSVAAVNAAGTGTRATRPGLTPSAAPVVPSAPVLGQLSSADASLVVRWTAPGSDGGSALTAYTIRVFQAGEAVTTVPADVGATTTTVSGLTNGTAYTVAVAAVNAVGTGPDSTRSAAIAPHRAPTAAAAPLIGSVTPADRSATVTWSAPPSDGGSPITSYTVRAYRGGVPVTSVLAAAAGRSAVVTGLLNGSAHTFTVSATNGVGAGPASATSAPVTPATTPGVPVVGSATAGDGSVQLHWSPPADDGGSPVTGYVVTVWTYGALRSALAVPGTATTTTVTGLGNGVPHTFTVAAVNGVGAGADSAHSAEVTPAGPVLTVPSAPTVGAATPGKSSVVVRWTPPGGDGGTPVTGYQVHAFRGATPVGTVSAGASARSVTVPGLANGTAYTFAIAAVNAVAAGPLSARTAAVTPRTVPDAPKIGTASPARGAAVVRWAAPASSGGAAISGYVVRVFSGGKLVRSVHVAAGARSVTVAELTAGRGYAFRVLAKNAAGLSAPSGLSARVVPRR